MATIYLLLVLLVTVMGTSGQGSDDGIIDLSLSPTSDTSGGEVAPNTPTLSGPSPVFRPPSVTTGLADPRNGASGEANIVKASEAPGNLQLLKSDKSATLSSPQPPSTSDQPSSVSAENPPPSVQVADGQNINSQDKTSSSNVISLGEDPNVPFIIYPEDDISLNRQNDQRNGLPPNINSLQASVDLGRNDDFNKSINNSDDYNRNTNDNKNNRDDIANSANSINEPDRSSVDRTSSSPSSGDTQFRGAGGPSLTNGIPPSQRLLRTDPGQSLLDFQPGGSSLYVSVQKPLQVSPARMCTFPADFGQDQFELSTSEFGYPKSIVQQALKDSVAEAVLKTLTDIMYEGLLATQVPGYERNRRLNSLYLINGGPRKGGQGIFGSGNLIESVGESGDGRLPLSSFGSLDSSFGQSNFGNSGDSFRLDSAPSGERNGETTLKRDVGSRQQGQSKGNEIPQESSSSNDGVSAKGQNNVQEQFTGTPGPKVPSDQPQDSGNQRETGSPSGNIPNSGSPSGNIPNSGSPSGNIPNSAFRSTRPDLPDTRFGNFEAFNNPSPFLSSSGGRRGILGGQDIDRSSSSNIDRLFPPKVSDMFLDDPPSPVGGETGDTPFISYNNGQRSQDVDGPFNFDSKSLFGSLPASPFGSSLSSTNSQGPAFGSSITGSNNAQGTPFGSSLGSTNANGQTRLSTFGPSNFGGTGSFFSDNGNPSSNSGSGQGSQGFPNSQFGFSRNFRRKKRQASQQTPDKIRVTATCSPTYKLLRQYKNYQGACFVVMPEAQGIYFAECSNSPCSGCRFDGGASRCTAQRVPTWVWSYCEGGPNKGKVMPDRVQVSVTCTCKTTQCQSAVNGR